ncbi:hypothetical protein B566_EDAN015414, partial [Ephemera danica]
MGKAAGARATGRAPVSSSAFSVERHRSQYTILNSSWTINPRIPITPKPKSPDSYPVTVKHSAQQVITLTCNVKNCTWSTKDKDKNLVLSRLKFHAKLFHPKITDIFDTCFEMFEKQKVFEQHICKNLTKFQCRFCKLSFDSKSEFTSHIKSVHDIHDRLQYNHQTKYAATLVESHEQNNSKLLTCKICNCNFFDAEKLLSHSKNFHLISSEINMDTVNFETPLIKKFVCNTCSSQFTQLSKFKLHYYKIHKTVIPTLTVSYKKSVKYYCNLCPSRNRNFNLTKLKQHYSEKHKKILDFSEFDVSNFCSILVSELCKEEGKVIFTCQHCPDLYSTAEDLNRHKVEKHGEFCCNRCTMIFDTEKAHKIHMEEVHFGECKFCDFTTFNFIGLHVHVTNKHTESLDVSDFRTIYKVKHAKDDAYHVCLLCQRCVSSQQNMKMHYFWFHNRFLCDYCKLNFSMSTFESEHFSSNHLTDCVHCNQSFPDFKALDSHLQTKHLNETYSICEFCGEDYKCTQCPMQFNFSRNLEQHVSELHTNRYAYSCTVCSKIFSTESDFNLHMKFHQGSDSKADLLPVLRCELCDGFSLNRDAMQKHVKRRHIKNGKLINVK